MISAVSRLLGEGAEAFGMPHFAGLQHHTQCLCTCTVVARFKLDTLKTRQTITKATMMYKIMGGLVDISPTCSTLTPNQR